MRRFHPALIELSHRPWPLPAARWTWRQSWLDLLFAHWPVPTPQVRRLVPAELEVQEFDGVSWVGVVPFRMTGVMRRPFPDLPWVSAFPELNVRVYVTHHGKPGVWFLSLDAANALAVWAARRFFHLPYWLARMSVTPNDAGGFDYRSDRSRANPSVTFVTSYRPVSEPYNAKPDSLEAFLVERYCLYAKSPAGKLFRADVHHAPWPLQRADATIDPRSMLAPHGLTIADDKPLLHFARKLDVVVWSPMAV